MSLNVIVLAGGVGKRMKSEKVKVLHDIMGKKMVEWVIETAKGLSPDSVTLVYGKKGETMESMFGGINYAFQPEPNGTGDAAEIALKDINEEKGDVLILSGDVPLLSRDTLEELYSHHRDNNLHATVLTFRPEDPEGYGRILREDELVKEIVEETDADEEEKKIREVNGGIYVFKMNPLRESLSGLNPDNAQGEYYLTDAISILQRKGYRVGAVETDKLWELQGVNTRQDLSDVVDTLRRRKIESLQNKGVTILNPDTVYIEPDVEVGRDTIIHPGTVLKGKTRIGENCTIKPFVSIEGGKISKNTVVES